MRCNQTNKKFKVDITLSKDDGTPLSQEDMNEGSQLLMEYKKKSWSVTVTSNSGPKHETWYAGSVWHI